MTAIRHAPLSGRQDPRRAPWLPILPAMVGAAWLLVLVGQVTGNAVLLHHHVPLLGTTAPPAVALSAFLVSWLVMTTATMLPASLRTVHIVDARNAGRAGQRRPLAIFLAAFVAVWMAFGVLVFGGDAVLQRAVSVMPWLAARPWLPAAAAVALAAAYQFTPLKARSLAACRHPARLGADGDGGASAGRLGLEHGLACVGNAWALMLVMVVAGLGDIWWLAAMAAVMAYEATGRYGQRAAAAVGVLLIWLAVLIALPGWLPT